MLFSWTWTIQWPSTYLWAWTILFQNQKLKSQDQFLISLCFPKERNKQTNKKTRNCSNSGEWSFFYWEVGHSSRQTSRQTSSQSTINHMPSSRLFSHTTKIGEVDVVYRPFFILTLWICSVCHSKKTASLIILIKCISLLAYLCFLCICNQSQLNPLWLHSLVKLMRICWINWL